MSQRWRDVQRRRVETSAARGRCELPAAWLTVEQNDLLATRGAERAPRFDPDAALDGHAGRRTLEIFAAILPFEWG